MTILDDDHPWETVTMNVTFPVKRVMVPLATDTAALLHAVATRTGMTADAWVATAALAALKDMGALKDGCGCDPPRAYCAEHYPQPQTITIGSPPAIVLTTEQAEDLLGKEPTR